MLTYLPWIIAGILAAAPLAKRLAPLVSRFTVDPAGLVSAAAELRAESQALRAELRATAHAVREMKTLQDSAIV